MKNKKLLNLTIATLSIATIIGSSVYAINLGPTNSASTVNTTTSYITEAKAKQIALTHAKVAEKDAVFVKVKLDRDDRTVEYEIEFYVGTKEYDYDINATTGKITSVDYDAEYYSPVQKAFPTKAPNGKTYITSAKAKEAALKHANLAEKNVTNLSIYFDYDDGIGEYEIKFYSGTKEYEYEINALTAAVVSFEQEEYFQQMPNTSVTPNAPVTPNAQTGTISYAQAKAIALGNAGFAENNVRRLQVKFDYDDGFAEYEVEFHVGNMEYSYEIDATTGTILSSEIDD